MLQKVRDVACRLNLTKDQRSILDGLQESDLLKCGVTTDDLLSDDENVVKCCAMKIIQRLYDLSKGYTQRVGIGVVVSQHSSYTELPMSKATRTAMLKFGRVELQDLWKLALHYDFYDATDAILHIKELGVIKYQPRKDSVEC